MVPVPDEAKLISPRCFFENAIIFPDISRREGRMDDDKILRLRHEGHECEITNRVERQSASRSSHGQARSEEWYSHPVHPCPYFGGNGSICTPAILDNH